MTEESARHDDRHVGRASDPHSPTPRPLGVVYGQRERGRQLHRVRRLGRGPPLLQLHLPALLGVRPLLLLWENLRRLLPLAALVEVGPNVGSSSSVEQQRAPLLPWCSWRVEWPREGNAVGVAVLYFYVHIHVVVILVEHQVRSFGSHEGAGPAGGGERAVGRKRRNLQS